MFLVKNGNNKIGADKADDGFTSSSPTTAPCSTVWLLVSLFWNEKEREWARDRHHDYILESLQVNIYYCL